MLLSSVKQEFSAAQQVLNKFIGNEDNLSKIGQAALLMADCLKSGAKIISCGNGGSHCDAMHFAEELTGRYRKNRVALAAIAISDPSHLSCVANDFGYSEVFSRFLEAIGKEGDVLLAISTSGQSENIVKAVETAKARAMKIIVLTGNDGGRLKDRADILIAVDHPGYADRIQELHIKIIHILIFLIEQLLFNQPG